jgi:hypothetical protein
MRIFKLAVAGLLAATAVPSAAAAFSAGDQPGYRQYQRAVEQQRRECRRDLRRADTQRERAQARRECRRELAQLERRYRRDMRQDRRDDRRDRHDDHRDRHDD